MQPVYCFSKKKTKIKKYIKGNNKEWKKEVKGIIINIVLFWIYRPSIKFIAATNWLLE